MSTPDNSATPENPNTQEPAKETPTAEEQLATEQQRRKDTQSAYTKGQQKNKSLEAENLELRKQIENQVQVTIPKEDQDRLDTLMYEDPKAWRKEMDILDTKSRGEASAKLEELTGNAKTAAEQTFELDRRQTVLDEFNESAKVKITEELISHDVPPRITTKLAEGKITFEEFLTEVETYVTTGKVVKNEEVSGQPNMGDLGGGKTPEEGSAEKALPKKYETDLY